MRSLCENHVTAGSISCPISPNLETNKASTTTRRYVSGFGYRDHRSMLIGSYPQQGSLHSIRLAVPALSYPQDQTARQVRHALLSEWKQHTSWMNRKK